MEISFKLNGKRVSAHVDAATRLIDMLRDTFGLVSVREGCSAGECGACTVILDGDAVCSCVMSAVQANGRDVTTTEGLSADGSLHVIQQAFLDCDAVQCGFCTTGMIMSAKALLMKTPSPTRDEIKTAMAGNICRCTGYLQIVNAVTTSAERMRGPV